MRRYFRGLAALAILGALCAGPAAAQPVQPKKADPFATKEGRTKVIGGRRALIDEWPWIATLRYNDPDGGNSGHVCGGSVIAPEWVLTAAHCVTLLAHKNVFFGSYPTDLAGQFLEGRIEAVLGADDVRTISADNVYGISRVIVR